MNDHKLRFAIAEAARFVKRANSLLAARKENGSSNWANPKEQGLAKRASMDLSRALSELRSKD